MASGRVDACVLTNFDRVEGSVAVEPLFPIKQYAVVHASHPLSSRGSVDPEDLAGTRVAAWENSRYNGRLLPRLTELGAELCDPMGDLGSAMSFMMGGGVLVSGKIVGDQFGDSFSAVPIDYDLGIIYQGEELGYRNVAWDTIGCYDDLSSHNQYAMALQDGKTAEQALAAVHAFSRDNARTPMQWDGSPNAGFSAGTPWLPVHGDYAACNVAAQDADPASVLNWYRRLAALRAACDVLVCGDYEELMTSNGQVYAFRRSWGDETAIVLANFTERPAPFDHSLTQGLPLALCTHPDPPAGILPPFGAAVYCRATAPAKTPQMRQTAPDETRRTSS